MNKSRIKVLVYPKASNPYQDLLYNNRVFSTTYITKYINITSTSNSLLINLIVFPLRLLMYRLQQYSIFHLHWLYEFKAPPFNGFIIKLFFTLYIIFIFLFIKLLGFKLVWTLHEVLPQEQEFTNDILVRRMISKLSDATFFHSNNSLLDAKKYGFSLKYTETAPHGNYNTSYENRISKKDARVKLQIKQNDFVFLFFGMIKPYKGIDDLLISFEKLLETNKRNNIKLIIAGKSEYKNLNNLISPIKNKYKDNIILAIRHIEDKEVQVFFNASDIVVLPFKKNTTSGSALLALSFNKPIIAPQIGSIKDLPTTVGYLYNANDKSNLLKYMKKAIKNRKELLKKSNATKDYSNTLNWDDLIVTTLKIYKALF